MAMSKQDFIALADMVRKFNHVESKCNENWQQLFTMRQIDVLAAFCQSQNPRFNRQRWLDYIAGKCGPNGGTVKG